MGKKLYVGNLDYSVTGEQLTELFSPHGEVVEGRVASQRESGRSRGFGFVTMSSEEEAQKAIEALDGHELSGRSIKVNEARTQGMRGGGGGGDRGGHGGGERRGFGGGGGGRGYGRR